jgi:hypothetical protein
MVNAVAGRIVVGVPEISPVVVLNISPVAAKAGAGSIEYVVPIPGLEEVM